MVVMTKEHTLDIQRAKMGHVKFMQKAVKIAAEFPSGGVVVRATRSVIEPCKNPKILFATNGEIK